MGLAEPGLQPAAPAPEVKAWLVRHRRFKLHFTPTSASWLNPRSQPSASGAASSGASPTSRSRSTIISTAKTAETILENERRALDRAKRCCRG
jgi:hypothetical protein